MKYKTQKTPSTIIKHIDSFKGVNTADAVYTTPENQLSEAVNMWNPNGVLKSRPALSMKGTAVRSYDRENIFFRTYERSLPPFKALHYCRIGAVAEVRTSGYASVYYYLTDSVGNKKFIEEIPFVSATGKNLTEIINVAFVFDNKIEGTGIFTVITLKENTDEAPIKKVLYYELDENLERFIAIDRKKFYVPVIMRYVKGNKYRLAVEQGKVEARETQTLEGVNIVNGAFSFYISCDGLSDVFNFPIKNVSLGDGESVIIDYAVSVMDTRQVVFGGNSNSVQINLFDKTIDIHLDRVNGKIAFTCEGEPYAFPITKADNTIKVTAYKYDNDKAIELFGNTATETYFDGRLLRAGADDSSNRLFFSGKDNHFYFYENGYIPVGEKDYAITAAASQNRYLFLFKENEIYRLRLEESPYYNINEIIEKNLNADIKPPKHTLMLVNSTVGCDCPQSIAFCTNRLVWYHSDGFVYCLYGTNSYTEGSVYVLSDDIKDRLKHKNIDKYGVVAAAFEGYYFLSIESSIYVMDALVSGFRYLSGMKTGATGNGGLSWYIWQLPENTYIYTLYSLSSKFYALVGSIGKNYSGAMYIAQFSEEKNSDSVMTADNVCEEKGIVAKFSTALITHSKGENSLLKKISIDIENQAEAYVTVFGREFEGRPFLIKPFEQSFKKAVYIPPYLCSGAGVKIKTTAPVTVNGLDFEFYKRG